MTINPLKRLLCLFGRHKRSRGMAFDDGQQITSVCRNCGVPMKRVDRRWIVWRRDEPSAG